MRGMIIRQTVAALVDDQGKTHIAQYSCGLWTFEGKTYRNPFEAFKEVEGWNL